MLKISFLACFPQVFFKKMTFLLIFLKFLGEKMLRDHEEFQKDKIEL